MTTLKDLFMEDIWAAEGLGRFDGYWELKDLEKAVREAYFEKRLTQDETSELMARIRRNF